MSSIQAQLAAAEARYRALQTKARHLDSKRETRRKIITGAAFLLYVGQLPPGARAELLARVYRQVTRDADRAALNLPPLPAPKSQVETSKAPRRNEPDSGDGGQGVLPM